MQMEGLPENNTVLIAGKIVKGCVFSHEVYGEGFYTFQISSERLSDKEDILPKNPHPVFTAVSDFFRCGR